MNEASKIIILTGHRKSGTSMFHRLFDNYPEINLYPVDISVLYAYFPYFTGNKDYSAKELRNRLKLILKTTLNSNNSNLNENEINSIIYQVNKTLTDDKLKEKMAVIGAIKNAWTNINGKNNQSLPFMFKETSQSIFFQEFKKDFPSIKMVSLIRDPRDNYAALKAGVDKYYSLFGESEKSTLASLINRVRVDFHSSKLNQILYPDSFLAIRFEDLVINPENIMKKVTQFLDLPFKESLLTPTISGKPYLGNSHDGKIFNGISNQNLGQWNKRISDEEAMIIEYWLKDLMEYWGYPIKFDPISSQTAFSKYYEWYNCQYFYHDSFSIKNNVRI